MVRALAGLALAVLLSAGCGGPLDRVRVDPALPVSGESGPFRHPGEVEITADDRVDLAYALVALARRNDLVVDDAAPLTMAAREELAAFAGHPAVEGVRRFFGSGLWTYPLVHLLLARESPPSLAPRAGLPPVLVPLLPGDSPAERELILNAWLEQVRDFTVRADFPGFMERHRQERAAQEQAVREAVGTRHPVALIEAYCGGRPFDRYLVHPSAFTRPELGYGPSLETPSGRLAFHLAGRASEQEPDQILHLLLHELGHSFVNPAVARQHEEVERRSHLFSGLEPAMRAAHYPVWRIALAEQLVEAVTARLLRKEYGPWAAERVLVLADEGRGYSLVEPLARTLVRYERQRERYPDLDTYLPVALAALEKSRDRPRWYGGADGIDQSAARLMLRRMVKAASRDDATLIREWVSPGVNRQELVTYLTWALPRELGRGPEREIEIEAVLQTVRRETYSVAVDRLEPRDGKASPERLVVTARLAAGPPERKRHALLRFTMARAPLRRLLSVGARVYPADGSYPHGS